MPGIGLRPAYLSLVAGAMLHTTATGHNPAAAAAFSAAISAPLSTAVDPLPLHRVAVFGSDDRRDLPPAQQSLERKIGTLTDLITRSQCTAFCLSETVVATAGHCLFRTRDESRPDLSNFRFQLRGPRRMTSASIAGSQSPAGVYHIASGSMSLSVKPPIEATRDWAIVKLDAPVCAAGGLPLSARSAADLAQPGVAAGTALYQIGYHRDFSNGRLAYGPLCLVSRSFRSADWATIQSDFYNARDLLLHSCDTGGGSSGSPLLIDGPHGPEVAGINVGTYVQSRILMVNDAVAHRYQAENVANTGVSATVLAAAFAALETVSFISTRDDMRDLQILLSGLGVFSGPRDGLFGPSSRQAIEAFERLNGLPVTGLATLNLLDRLRTLTVAKAMPAMQPTAAVVETGSVRGFGLTTANKRKAGH